MIKVYIASPYTIGDQAENVKRQMNTADELIRLGFCPFVPLLYHFQHMFNPQPYDTWLDIDMEWLCQCNAVLRLDGESKGADIEVERAKKLHIPVFTDIVELYRYYQEAL